MERWKYKSSRIIKVILFISEVEQRKEGEIERTKAGSWVFGFQSPESGKVEVRRH